MFDVLSNFGISGYNLIHAIRNNEQRHIAAVLKRGFNLNQVFYNTTLLIEAISTGNEDLMHRLIRAGADVDLGNEEFVTPLCAAAKQNNVIMVQTLLTHKADIHKFLDGRPSFLVRTPLHYAIANNNLAMVQLLMEKGHDVNYPTLGDLHPIEDALLVDNVDMVKLILDHPKFNPKQDSCLGLDPMNSPVISNKNLDIGRAFLECKKRHLFHRIDKFETLLERLLKMAPRYRWIIDTTKLIVHYGGDTLHARESVYKQWLDNGIQIGNVAQRIPIITVLVEVGLRPTEREMRLLQDMCVVDEEREMVRAVQKTCSVPMPLEKICQLVIRYSLGLSCTEKAKLLPLPPRLCDFVGTNGIKLGKIKKA